MPDLRHVGIKTSLAYSEKKEDLNTYDSKKGLRDAISQAYRRYIYFLSREKFEKKETTTNSLSPHNADYLHSEMMIKILGSYYLLFSTERSYSCLFYFSNRNSKDTEEQKPEDTETISRHGDTLAIFQTMLDNLYSPRETE